jgi:hypothetical protein
MQPTALLWLKGQYQNTNQQGVHGVGANMYVCVLQKCTKFTMGSRCMPILPKSGLQQNLQVVNALCVCQLLDYVSC